MKPIIGILTRPDSLQSGNKVEIIYEDIKTSIIKSGGIPIGIIPGLNVKDILDICDGVILQGGDSFFKYELNILKYIYEKDIPVLGICLGMQLMGSLLDGKLVKTNNHLYINKKYAHKVAIDKSSKLYKILGVDKIIVNSRHKEKIINPNCDIVGISEDGVIEAIEDKKKKFFVGVAWHPENMYSYDILERKIFDYFIFSCRK